MEEIRDNEMLSFEEAVQWVKGRMEAEGISQEDLAKECGFSGGGLSNYMNQKYASNSTSYQNITQKITKRKKLLEDEMLKPKAPAYVPTTVTKLITQAIAYAHVRGVVTFGVGDAGVGKTTAMLKYIEENPVAIGITIQPVYSSIAGVYELLRPVLGIKEKSMLRMTGSIIQKLQGSGRVIIVDEAQFLTFKAIEQIRSISDATQVGVCLIGNEQLYTQMLGVSNERDMSRLRSRMSNKRIVTVNTNTKEDIKHIFGSYVKDEGALETLYQISKNIGCGLRGAINVYINSIGVYHEVTVDSLNRVIRDLGIIGGR